MSYELYHHSSNNVGSLNGFRVISIFLIGFLIERLCWVVLGVLTTLIRRFLNLPSFYDELLRIINISLLGIFQLFFWIIVMNFTFSKPLTSITFSLNKSSFGRIGIGFFITTIFLLIIFIIEVILKILIISSVIYEEVSLVDFFIIFLRSLTVTFWIALIEEFVYRGFLLLALCKAWGTKIGIILMTILFSVPHFLIQEAPTYWVQYIFLLIIASLLFAYCYLKTQSITLSFGIHLAFNFISQDAFNLSTDAGTNLFGFVTTLNISNIPIISFFMEFNFLGLYLSLLSTFCLLFMYFQLKPIKSNLST